MKIAFLGTIVTSQKKDLFPNFLRALYKSKVHCCFEYSFYQEVKKNILQYWDNPEVIDLKKLPSGIKCFVSIGGDGTMIKSAKKIIHTQLPIIGVNFGNLGFLTSIALDQFNVSLKNILSNNCTIENRSLLQIHTPDNKKTNLGQALNEISFHKHSHDSIITISVYLENILVNTYWADGLLVVTPTGSTAYNISCGGPIIYPTANCWVINPIASHNIDVRPLIIPDHLNVRIKIESRLMKTFILALDGSRHTMSNKSMVTISKYSEQVQFIQLPETTFFNTVRQKLYWGSDIRN
ncbi:MAG: NAD(+)/NADH kinase [Chitinophagaceae bacterium]